MSKKMQLYDPFVRSAADTLALMAGIKTEVLSAFGSDTHEFESLGITSVIHFTGKVRGRFLLDMEPGLALAATQNITGALYGNIRDGMVLATISELNNIISGAAVSALNNEYQLGLWLSPPYVFTGKPCLIALPRMQSASVDCRTLHGKLKINVAFERSD